MQPIVKLNNVRYERSGRVILKDVSWTIEQGQHWALLGANGSGKTSLLKVITGYEWTTSGSVEVLNQRYGNCNLRQLRKQIGWVSTALEHKLPGDDLAVEIVISGLDATFGIFRDITEKELKLASESLELVNAQDCAEKIFGILSQGEQQRILIARALINQPSLLILDEPCIGLDPAAKERFLCDLSCFANRDNAPTMIVVTHHIEEIDPWINHVMLLKNGEVLSSGHKTNVLTSELLSDAFDVKMHIKQEKQRYYLSTL